MQLDLLSHEGEVQRLLLAFSMNPDTDFRPRFSAGEVANVIGFLVRHRHTVHFQEHISRNDPLALRRIAIHDIDDFQGPVAQSDRDPDAAVLPIRQQVYFISLFLGDIDRVRIQRAEHPVDASLHELFGIHLIDVVCRNFLVDTAKQGDAAVDFQVEIGVRHGHKPARGQHDAGKYDGQEPSLHM